MMAFRAHTDAFGFEMPADARGYARLAGRTFLLDQLIALPVALAMTSAGMSFWRSYGIASMYAQAIGALCATFTAVFQPWLDRLSPRTGRLGVIALYFIAGVSGAEIARRLSLLVFGPAISASPPYISWAIGATVALLVGLALTVVRHLRARVLSTELEALQARINPHFLFNTLNSIAALIREDPARAEAMTLRLSSLFRYTLTAPRRGLVRIDEEMSIVEGYLAIEQERIGPRLSYDIQVDPAVNGFMVPALTVQPLVENAVKHGIAAAMNGGAVRVRGRRDGPRILLTVTDTGGGTHESGGTGEGLENVRRRLRATFGSGGILALERRDGTTEARITFPAIHGEP